MSRRAFYKNNKLFVPVVCTIFLFFCSLSVQAAGIGTLKEGSKGSEVKLVQEMLDTLGYMLGEPDGIFGKDTTSSVRNYQSQNDLNVDGVVGAETFKKLNEEFSSWISRSYKVQRGDSLWSIAHRYGTNVKALADINDLSVDSTLQIGVSLRIPPPVALTKGDVRGATLVPWNTARKIYEVGDIATVIDVDTGLSFQVMRRGGYYHADTEPLTYQDTQIVRRAYGGTYSWERHAVILVIDNYRIAASMNGMPHGEQRIKDNGFNGHFCIHFLGSRIHLSGAIDAAHQAMVRKAAGQI